MLALPPILALFASISAAAAAATIEAAASGSNFKVPISRPKLSSSDAGASLARARSFSTAAGVPGSAPIINNVTNYLAVLKIGSQEFSLLMDTGSSNMCPDVGFEPGTTAVNTGNNFSVFYEDGEISGIEYNDTVSLGGLTVHNQSIGVATSAFSGTLFGDGFLGLGPPLLTEDTVTNVNEVPTLLNNLFSQNVIKKEVLGLSFAQNTGDTPVDNGEIDLGELDSSKYTGEITYSPLTTTFPFSDYWGLNVSAITYGSSTLLSTSSGAIVDTGTTFIWIPGQAFTAFLNETGGTTANTAWGPVASFTTAPTSSLSFVIAGVSHSLLPSQYIIPTDQLSILGIPDGIYAWVANGEELGSLDFIIGQKFLEYFYSVYDTSDSRIGLAPNACT